MNTNDARIAKDGAIVAIPCISIPGSPTAFSCNPVLTVPWLVFRSSTATVSLLAITGRKQIPPPPGAFAHGLIICSTGSIDPRRDLGKARAERDRPGLGRRNGQAR